MKAYNILLAISSFLLFSCDLYKLENEVHKGLVQEESKLVIISFIAPQDTMVLAIIAKSFPIYGKINFDRESELRHVKDAEVIISNGTVSKKLIEMLFEDNNEYYNNDYYYYGIPSSEFPIVAGESYTITATTPDGLRATAHCTIPMMKSNVDNYELKTSINEWGGEMLNLIVSWKDIVQAENFYRIIANIDYTITDIPDTIIHQKVYFYDFSIYIDHNRDGEILKEKGNTYIYQEYLDSLTIQLFTTDYHYYQYHTSIENYESGNPFAEPSRIYSNVENGYGVFAGYQKSVFIVDLD